jgi:hypothetical protein
LITPASFEHSADGTGVGRDRHRSAAVTPSSRDNKGEDIMRKFIAIVAALGFLGTTSLTPVLAASALDSTKTDTSSAGKKDKKAAKKSTKKTAKKGKKAGKTIAKKGKKSGKKVAKKSNKKPGAKKANKKTADATILYRIAA